MVNIMDVLKWIVGSLLTIIMAFGAWFVNDLKYDIRNNTEDITKLKTDVNALQAVVLTVGEIKSGIVNIQDNSVKQGIDIAVIKTKLENMEEKRRR